MPNEIRPPLTDDDSASPTRVKFHAYPDADAWASACAGALAAIVRRDLERNGHARLLLSGGTTPAPVYRALSKTPLHWNKVDIALVDERWLQPDDADSNARLVRDTLLQNHAKAAHFEPMTRVGRTLEEAVATANAHARRQASAAVLGMGEDGHTASLFPGARDLARALASHSDYVSFDASGCPGAGAWPLRITLTPQGLSKARERMLLVRGESKRKLLDRVPDSDDIGRMPVRAAFTTPGAALQIHWCP
ncbi:6-phosphogluconolactonase [Luteimonas sp. SX5]|uniref:6-phosphogluconolactonase n=1 Tax=Luteimonas galliterrae TaxID=2940486 RepID=A0ABT0MGL7_9GAMM|nr:6-phosphogluconolactonase [Luteimonas galliterrae]MCL1633803.1 6-phosphogluconolactonase [Luteimonas galliterrae]